jgi:hypothetical protein
MDQPALDQRLGAVGANPPCYSRTATHLVTLDHRYSRKRRRQAASTDIAQIKEGCAYSGAIKNGLEAIDVEDAVPPAPKTSVHSTLARAVETPAPEATASRKRISVAA